MIETNWLIVCCNIASSGFESNYTLVAVRNAIRENTANLLKILQNANEKSKNSIFSNV